MVQTRSGLDTNKGKFNNAAGKNHLSSNGNFASEQLRLEEELSLFKKYKDLMILDKNKIKKETAREILSKFFEYFSRILIKDRDTFEKYFSSPIYLTETDEDFQGYFSAPVKDNFEEVLKFIRNNYNLNLKDVKTFCALLTKVTDKNSQKNIQDILTILQKFNLIDKHTFNKINKLKASYC